MKDLNDPEFILALNEIKLTDLDLFMELILMSLKTFPEMAVKDDVPVENKLSALDRVIKHFENLERYEDCAFIRDIQKNIKHAEKR